MQKLVIIAKTDFSGGAEIYIAKLGESLNAAGVDVTLGGRIVPWPATLNCTEIRLGPKWGLRSLPLGVLRAPFELLAVSEFLKTREGATFNFHFKREQILFTWLASRRGKVVWTEHGTFPAGLFGRLISRLYRFASDHATEIVCVSDLVARSIQGHVPDSRKLRVINSSVDTDLFHPLDPCKSSTDRVALVIGRLEKTKRPHLSISAALAAGCHVLVAGTGRLEDSLKAEFGENPSVEFIGHARDVASLYRSASVHIFSSNGVGEGFPTVLLESAASGIPTVAADDCGFAMDVFSAGGAAANANVESLAESIRLVMDELPRRSKVARDWAMSRRVSDWTSAYQKSFFGYEAP